MFLRLSFTNVHNKVEGLYLAPFQPSLMFASKAFQHLSGAPLKGRLLALPIKIRLGRKGLRGTKAPAYYENS